MSKVIFEVSVYVQGIKKRCRNVDRHSFKIEEIDFKELSSEDVNLYIEKAKTLLKSNMKESQRAIISFRKMEIGEFFRTCQMYDPANKEFNIEL